MPQQNYIGENGIVTQSLNEILDDLKNQFLAIYPTANLEQNTPDGQWINILAQEKKDIIDFITGIYNNLDTDTTTGIPQQILYKLNGLEIKAYGYSYVYVNVTVNQAVTLQGLDADINNADGTGFTVTDTSGNRWILADTQTPTEAGTYLYNFRAADLGEIKSAINTITVMETILPGVTGVNNPAANYITGGIGESASQFRVRRSRSVTMPSQGFADSIEAQLLTFDDITEARVYDNTTGSTDANGIPAHGVWVIVRGGNDEEIGKVIYNNIPPGIPMKTAGCTPVNVIRPNGNTATVYYGSAQPTDLHVDIYIKIISGSPDEDYIKSQLETMSFEIGQAAEAVNIAVVVKDAIGDIGTPYNITLSASPVIDTSGILITSGITDIQLDASTFITEVSATAGTYSFSYNGSNWILNGNTVNMTDYGITITGSPVHHDAIVVTYGGYSEIVTPSAPDEYFTISAANVTIHQT